MKIIFDIIFFSYFILPLINCEDNYIVNLDGEDCSYASSNPEYPDECINYSTEETACCFVEIEKQDRTKINKCVEVERDARFALNHLTIFSLKANDGDGYPIYPPQLVDYDADEDGNVAQTYGHPDFPKHLVTIYQSDYDDLVNDGMEDAETFYIVLPDPEP